MDRVLQLCYTSLITHADILSHLLLKPLSRSSNEQNASQAAAMTHNFYKEFVSPELLPGQVLLEKPTRDTALVPRHSVWSDC